MFFQLENKLLSEESKRNKTFIILPHTYWRIKKYEIRQRELNMYEHWQLKNQDREHCCEASSNCRSEWIARPRVAARSQKQISNFKFQIFEYSVVYSCTSSYYEYHVIRSLTLITSLCYFATPIFSFWRCGLLYKQKYWSFHVQCITRTEDFFLAASLHSLMTKASIVMTFCCFAAHYGPTCSWCKEVVCTPCIEDVWHPV